MLIEVKGVLNVSCMVTLKFWVRGVVVTEHKISFYYPLDKVAEESWHDQLFHHTKKTLHIENNCIFCVYFLNLL